MILRTAGPGDEVQLAAIDAAASAYPWRRQQFGACCAPQGTAGGQRAELLLMDDVPAAYVVFMRVLDEATIVNIATNPAFQRRGLGRILLQHAIALLVAQGAARCLLEVRETNEPARRFYQSMGFVIDGTRRAYFRCASGREDAILMSRTL